MYLKQSLVLTIPVFFLLVSCKGRNSPQHRSFLIQEHARIVSLSGTLTEILCGFGFEKNIVGVDVTSTYPESIQKLPKVGHNQNISSEGIISLDPTLVIGFKEDIRPLVVNQLKAVGIKVLLLGREYSVKGTRELIRTMADTLGATHQGQALKAGIQQSLAQVKPFDAAPKVLFIYARGAGTLLVAGQNTAMDRMIKLAGGINAAQGFEDYKPLTAEALVAAGPEVILMFSSGIQSLQGVDGLQSIPGIALTDAYKHKAIITMDGQYLSGFGPRLGRAVLELNRKLHDLDNENKGV